MRDFGLRIATMALLIASAACAHAQSQPGSEAEAYMAPKLIGCPGYVPGVPGAGSRIEVQAKVKPDGSVDPTSPRYRRPHRDRGGESAIGTALSLASGCRFEPARRGDEPVEAWATVRFLLAR